MALDVQPISPTRKAVMLIVLLALFIASLGLAQWIVGKRRQSGPWSATGSPAFEIRGPSGFEPDTTDANIGITQEAALALRGTVDGAPRFFYAFKFPITRLPKTLDDLTVSQWAAQRALWIYQKYIPAAGLGQMEAAELAGNAAVDISGPFNPHGGFTRLRAGLVGKEIIVLLYIGRTSFTPQDAENWQDAADL